MLHHKVFQTSAGDRAKRLVHRVLCHDVVAKAIDRAFAGRITSGGFVFDTRSTAIPLFVVPRLFWGMYERGEIDFTKQFLNPELDVVELGACIGVVGTHVASRLRNGAKLVSLEANPNLVQVAEKNIRANVPLANAVVVHGAIASGEEGSVGFQVADDAVSSSLGEGHGAVRVPTITLGQLIANHEIGDYTLICDIEGAEESFLCNFNKALERCQLLIIELHPEKYSGRAATMQAIVEQLAADGLQLLKQRGDVFAFARRQARRP